MTASYLALPYSTPILIAVGGITGFAAILLFAVALCAAAKQGDAHARPIDELQARTDLRPRTGEVTAATQLPPHVNRPGAVRAAPASTTNRGS